METPASEFPKKLVVPAALAGERLDHILSELIPSESRARLQKWVRRGRVLVEGRKLLRSNVRLAAKVTLTIHASEEAARPPIEVLHEDAQFLVIHKPAGVVVHPTERIMRATLSDWLVERYGPLPSVGGAARPGIVHRLDRETSGVMVVARSQRALHVLRQQFRARRVKKTYQAIAFGQPPSELLKLTQPLGPVQDDLDRQRVFPPTGAKEARTAVSVLERFEGFSSLECRPETGRRHQIRVHLAAAGLPIVADQLYARRESAALPPGAPPLARHALHARRLGLYHPTTGAELSFEAPLPADLERWLAWLRTNRAQADPA